MGRPKGSKNKKSSESSPSKSSPTKVKFSSWPHGRDGSPVSPSDQGNSLDTPKHYYNMNTPKTVQQYAVPPGLSQRFDHPDIGPNTGKHHQQEAGHHEDDGEHTPVHDHHDHPSNGHHPSRHPGLAKVLNTPKFTQADQTESDDSDDDIEDETYDEIVDVFQNKTQVVKKLNQDILENMNYEMPKDISEQEFASKVAANQVQIQQQSLTIPTDARSQILQRPKHQLIQNSRLEIALANNTENGNSDVEVAVEVSTHKVQIALKSENPIHVKETHIDAYNNSEHDPDDPGTDTDDDLMGSEKGPVRIIRLGTEEVKKYAIINKKDTLDNTDDEEDYDREDREELYEDEEEAMENDPEAQAWLNNYTERQPEATTLKVAKKYPSKQKFPCPKCPKIWNWPWELRRHLMIHFKPQKLNTANSFPCTHEGCDKKFQWKRDMKQHERIHTGEKLLVCSVCEKKFTTRQALLHHVVVHTGERPFQCAVCGNRFTQPANLRTHVKKRHNYSVESNKQNKCEYCGEPHASIVGLHQHLLEDHPQQVQEERELLAREKSEKLAEKMRMQKAKDDRRLQREKKGKKSKLKEWEMDYEFYIGEGLVRGVDWDRTPSNGEIACGQCERKFGWRYEIMFHGLCHLMDGEGSAKNKVCPECDTPFKVPIGLKHHLITHTGETPFLCLHCWKSFSSHIDLKLHIKKEHLMHLNTDTGDRTVPDTPKHEIKRKSMGNIGKSYRKESVKKLKKVSNDGIEMEVEEEKTSHFVQLDDGTYAEMVEGHEMVAPGHQMLVEDQDGQKLVVVNPGPGEEPQTIVVPEQAETVYVIASQDGAETIVPEQNSTLENILKKHNNLELVVDSNGDQKYILSTDVVEQQQVKSESIGQSVMLGIAEEDS
eukprot:GFUD01021986.1.p1 GENE.GFUD01021986.1~~GFUD01021986.1.p1  ORF type:complete len:883 (-),score=305.65 GFUD01021986.1:45-2693(-)